MGPEVGWAAPKPQHLWRPSWRAELLGKVATKSYFFRGAVNLDSGTLIRGEALSVFATSPHCGFMEAGESRTQRTWSPREGGGSAMETALLGTLMCLTGSATPVDF